MLGTGYILANITLGTEHARLRKLCFLNQVCHFNLLLRTMVHHNSWGGPCKKMLNNYQVGNLSFLFPLILIVSFIKINSTGGDTTKTESRHFAIS